MKEMDNEAGEYGADASASGAELASPANMPVANAHMNTGPQGNGGPLAGPDVPYTHNPRGIVPKVIGHGMGSLVQGPVQPTIKK